MQLTDNVSRNIMKKTTKCEFIRDGQHTQISFQKWTLCSEHCSVGSTLPLNPILLPSSNSSFLPISYSCPYGNCLVTFPFSPLFIFGIVDLSGGELRNPSHLIHFQDSTLKELSLTLEKTIFGKYHLSSFSF